MSPDRLDDLVLAHLEGRASPEDDRLIETALAEDPDAGRRFAELSLQEGLLREIAETEELVRRRRPRRRRPASATSTWWIWTAAAAVFVLLVGLVARRERPTAPVPVAVVEEVPAPGPEPSPFPRPAPPPPEPPQPQPVLPAPQPPPAPPREPPPPRPEPEKLVPPPHPPRPTAVALATLERVEGPVELDGVRTRRVVLEGQVLLTGLDGYAAVRYDDGTRLEVDPGTSLRLEDAAGKRVRVERGVVYAVVTRQPADRPMVLSTPNAEARVLGTRLRLAAKETSTELAVTEGRVRLSRDGASVEVPAEHVAIVSPGQPLAAKRIVPLFSDGFDAAAVGQWPAGWRKHDTEAATRSGYAVLGDARQRFLGIASPASTLTQHAVLPVDDWGPAFTVSFRLRLTGPRITRAGIEIGERRMDPSVEVDAVQGVARIDWPRGRALKQAPCRIVPGAWTEWSVSVDGGRFKLSIDRKGVLEHEIPDFGRVRGASLVSRGADPAQFDDVRVIRR